MIDITIKITEGTKSIYGATIEVEKKEDAEKLGNDVREAIADILMKYYNPEDDSN